LFLKRSGGIEFRAADLNSLPPALARRLVRHAAQLVKGDLRRLEFHHIEKVRELAHSPKGTGKAQLPGLLAHRSYDWLRLSKGCPSDLSGIRVTLPCSYEFPCKESSVSLEVVEKTGASCRQSECGPYGTLKGEVCWSLVDAPLELRSWHSGDCYWPEGRDRAYQVKELLGNLRVPSWRRQSWPILLSRPSPGRERILWTREFGVAKGLAVREDYTGPVLRIWEKQESFEPVSAS